MSYWGIFAVTIDLLFSFKGARQSEESGCSGISLQQPRGSIKFKLNLTGRWCGINVQLQQFWQEYHFLLSIMSELQGNYSERITDNSIPYFHDFKPCENNFTGKKTCTSNIYDLQYGLIQTGKKSITRKDIANTLAKRCVLRQVETIQVSSKMKFASIEFDTTSTMETFCLEPLIPQDDFQALFIPDFRK